MKNTLTLKLISALAVTLGSAWGASAQTTTESTYGLLGSTYVGANFGYTHDTDGGPSVLHDYGVTYNQSVFYQEATGIDLTAGYDTLSGSKSGETTHRQAIDLGLTGYLTQPWGKPFVSGVLGWDWQRSNGQGSHSLAYTLSTGVEFQLLKSLVLTPEVSYVGTPRLVTARSAGNLPNFDWTYGAAFTYRIERNWSTSLGAYADRDRSLTYKAGVSYHF